MILNTILLLLVISTLKYFPVSLTPSNTHVTLVLEVGTLKASLLFIEV